MLDSDIITRCPQCNTAFRVTLNQLSVADGLVRCGSCLAVFKAESNQSSETETTEHHEQKPSTTNNDFVEASSSEHTQSSSDDTLITDDDEIGLTLDDDVYDLDSASYSKKTSLFDRQLKPISEHTKESADESWALDILADLEDDDDSPLIIKRQSPEETSEKQELNIAETSAPDTLESKTWEPEAIEPETQTELSTEVAIQAELEPEQIIETSSADNEFDELLSLDANPEEQEPTAESSTKKKFSFSFFKRKEKKVEEKDAIIEEDNTEKDEFFFEEEERLIDDSAPDLQSHNKDLLADHKTSIQAETEEFIEDEILISDEINDLSELDKAIDNNTDDEDEILHFDSDYSEPELDINENKDSQQNPYIDEASPYNIADEHSQISDEEIDYAINTETSYANESKDYLAQIQPAPVEMEWYESERTQQWLWTSGAVLLSLTLLLQLAVFRFDTLAKNPSYRPYYQSACNVIGCKLPALIDLSKIRATNLIVRSHPQQTNALIIDAILINTASYSQAYPGLKIEFSDLNNNIVASRQLQPDEYLLGELAGAKEMPINQPIQLSLSIVDPGSSAINYQLNVIKANK